MKGDLAIIYTGEIPKEGYVLAEIINTF